MEAFKTMGDGPATGKIDVGRLRGILTTFGDKLSAEEVRTLRRASSRPPTQRSAAQRATAAVAHAHGSHRRLALASWAAACASGA